MQREPKRQSVRQMFKRYVRECDQRKLHQHKEVQGPLVLVDLCSGRLPLHPLLHVPRQDQSVCETTTHMVGSQAETTPRFGRVRYHRCGGIEGKFFVPRSKHLQPEKWKTNRECYETKRSKIRPERRGERSRSNEDVRQDVD